MTRHSWERDEQIFKFLCLISHFVAPSGQRLEAIEKQTSEARSFPFFSWRENERRMRRDAEMFTTVYIYYFFRAVLPFFFNIRACQFPSFLVFSASSIFHSDFFFFFTSPTSLILHAQLDDSFSLPFAWCTPWRHAARSRRCRRRVVGQHVATQGFFPVS